MSSVERDFVFFFCGDSVNSSSCTILNPKSEMKKEEENPGSRGVEGKDRRICRRRKDL